MREYQKPIEELRFVIEQIYGVKFYLLFSHNTHAKVLAVTSDVIAGVKGILISTDLNRQLVIGDVAMKTHDKIAYHLENNGELTKDIERVIAHCQIKHPDYKNIQSEERKLLKSLGA